ncbi:hypothetical protein IKT64_02945 [Candidatus Saccharibacteria bacterium]|nr:hypothetical protein [Candidatus Saccharibacteria bacterium]
MVISHEKFVVAVGVKRHDYAKQFDKEGITPATDTIVLYDKEHGYVVVDERAADDDYLKWAAVQEVACGSSKEEFCGLKLPQPDDLTRRKAVEKIMLTVVLPQKDKEAYVRKRIEAYLALMDLCQDDVKSSLVDAYAFLQLWLINHTGKHFQLYKGGRNL